MSQKPSLSKTPQAVSKAVTGNSRQELIKIGKLRLRGYESLFGLS